MPQATNRLSARQFETLKAPGLHADGGGLYLKIRKTGSRQWVYIFQFDGKRREMGLGTANKDPKLGLGLPAARDARDRARGLVIAGTNPIAAPAVALAPDEIITFGKLAGSLISDLESGWKNEKHRQQWRNSLKTHAAPIWEMAPGVVSTDDVTNLLRPIWTTIPETADRVRGRIERVLDAARVKKLIVGPWENPARWKGHLALILPQRKKLQRGHHAAMPYQDIPAFVAALQARPALAARALEVTLFCASRSGEVLGAQWSEVDLAEKVWTIPGERMKAGVEHRVPLCGRALDIFTELLTARAALPGAERSEYVFPGERSGRPLSSMSMEMLLRRMGYGASERGGTLPNYTVHGMRSAFRDWAGDETDYPEEIAEAALAHVVGSPVRRAYRRGDALDKRRELMVEWDAYARGIEAARLAAE